MLNKRELERYNSQIIFKKFGKESQEKLKKAKALLVGVGGLGSVISTLLVRAGIGELKIVDRDVVELSNLQRQILYDETDIGKSKAKLAKEKLRKVNKNVKIKAFKDEITKDNVLKYARNVDIILDGTDNMKARFALNHASVKLKIPFVHAGCEGFSGVCAVFVPKKACFACLYKECEEKKPISVLGPTPVLAGSMSSGYAIQMLSNTMKLKTSFMTVFSLIDNEFDTYLIKKDTKCAECGK